MVYQRFPAALTAALTAAVLITMPATTTASASTTINLEDPMWTAGPVPIVAGPASLRDVSVISAEDVWAVGRWSNPSLPLVVRWMGEAWMSVRTPDDYELVAVEAVASGGGVWVAGRLKPDSTGRVLPLLSRYADGLWQSVPIALPAGTSGRLTDVAMVGAGSGWAVGWAAVDGVRQPLILNGVAGVWLQTIVPFPGTDAELSSVYVAGPTDVWAVGTARTADGSAGLILHWNGTGWRREGHPPVPPGAEQRLNAISGNGGEMWAVGESCMPMPIEPTCEAVLLRNDGLGWKPMSGSARAAHSFVEVVVVAPDDVWLFGYATPDLAHEQEHVEHWDGNAFTVVNARPYPAAAAAVPGDFPAAGLVAARAVPGTRALWAVGWLDDRTTGRPNVMRYQ